MNKTIDVVAQKIVGQPLNRVDGRLKVTGAARYPAEFPQDNLAHAVIVKSTIARGQIKKIDTHAAEAAPGVLAVLTSRNVPRLQTGPANFLGSEAPPPLQDDHIYYHGQHIAVVIAETLEQATFAATLVSTDYEGEEPILSFDDPRTQLFKTVIPDILRGDPDDALAQADVRIDETYITPINHHNPMALFSTIAHWDGGSLTLYDTTQWVDNVRTVVATILGIKASQVHIISPYIGGAFGAGIRTWPHVILAALAARHVGRPVKLVLTREQMYTSIGYRPQTVQRMALGATRDGQLVSTIHEGIEPSAMADSFYEYLIHGEAILYACPNLRASYRQARLNVGTPTWMRGPGESQLMFALETAMDELSYALDCDPIDLRLKNDTLVDPMSGKPWSSRGLRECLELGHAQFGWERRTRAPRSMRDGKYLVGWGVSSSVYPYLYQTASARVRILIDGSGQVQTSASDLGTGTYTILTQIAADVLGIPPENIQCELGDSSLPATPPAAGSMLAASVGSAVQKAATAAIEQILAVVQHDEASPIQGARANDVFVQNGRIILKNDPTRSESYSDIMKRHDLREIEAIGTTEPPAAMKQFGTGIFGAKFVEVRVDMDLGKIQIARVLSVTAGGAHSQREDSSESDDRWRRWRRRPGSL